MHRLFAAPIAGPILPPGASSGSSLFMSTPASTPAGSVGTITRATPGNAAASTLFGAAYDTTYETEVEEVN